MKLMYQTMRWFGNQDPVKLSYIKQAGCEGVVTALHHIPVGDVWTIEEILQRKRMIELEGLTWTVVESLPVSDDIKRQNGDWLTHIEHYKTSLKNLAACGLQVITYNFMPVFDWLRTDISFTLPDGSKALRFDRLAFIAFDVFILDRPGSKNDYTVQEVEDAASYLQTLSQEQQNRLFQNCMLGLPGSDTSFTKEQVFAELEKYKSIDRNALKQNLFYFLAQVAPVAQSCGLKLAIHPDDPPYSILGLPRVMSTEADAAELLSTVDIPANGLCFCTGSFGARADNDIVQMVKRFGDRIHFLHLRNTKRDEFGNFFEADHLAGDTNLYAVINEVFKIQQQRDWSIPVRPDHGHQMLDDLQKTTYPGYSAIGRLRGLAEIRGVEYAIAQRHLLQQ